MITLENICKDYNTAHGPMTVLQDVSLQVAPAEIYGIIGRSGAGKSTLIRCINFLERPSSGRIIVNNENLHDLTPQHLRRVRRKIGMIFQHFNLLSGRTVYENIRLPLEFLNYSKSAAHAIILPLLNLTGLEERKEAYPAQLSGGQKQRVAIARALASSPDVLLCDEITSALDPETSQTILQLLQNIRDELGLTILLITHEMSVIKAACDRVGILEQGRLVEENEVGEFFAYPKTEIAKNFIFSLWPQTLPPFIQQCIESTATAANHPLIHLWFLPDTATKPIVAELINRFQLRINILQANVEYVKQHPMGMMLVAIDGASAAITNALAYLAEMGVNTEVKGYVPNNIISFD